MASEKKTIHEQMIEDMDHICPIWDQVQLVVLLTLGALLLDYFNVPSRLIDWLMDRITPPAFDVLVAALVLLVFVQMVKRGVFSTLFVGCTSQADVFCVVSSLTAVICGVGHYYIWEDSLIVRFMVLYSALVGMFIFLRYTYVYSMLEADREQEDKLIDLEVLYGGDFKHTPGEPILVSERAVDYDLFDRAVVTGQLADAITHCQSAQSYVISLEGEWGTGKSTILNLAREKIERTNPGKFAFIEDFAPWLYGSQEELLRGLFDTLMKHAGGRHMSLRDRNELDSLVKAVADHYSGGNILYHALRVGRSQQDMVEALKGRISAYIRAQKKQFVFFIDDLDRASAENIILLFKLISQVFDLPGVVYVLAFERERVNHIFEKTDKLNDKFAEKIIQQEIIVPPLAAEKKWEVFEKCMKTLLEKYGMDAENIERCQTVIDYSSRKINEARKFKRMINIVFPRVFSESPVTNALDKRDFLGIELIRFCDCALYEEIKGHPEVFCIGKIYEPDFYGKKYDEYLEDIFEKHRGCREAIYSIFPNTDKYRSSKIDDNGVPICRREYFSSYFDCGTSKDMDAAISAQSLVDRINAAENQSDISIILEEELKKISENESALSWKIIAKKRIKNIKDEKVFGMVCALNQIVSKLDITKDEAGIGMVQYSMAKLLYRCSEEEVQEYIDSVRKDYQKKKYHCLSCMVDVCNQLYNESERNTGVSVESRDKIAQVCTDMVEEIFDNDIDIYGDEYQAGDVYRLVCWMERAGKKKNVGEYISHIFKKENMYAILKDTFFVGSVGTTYDLIKKDMEGRIRKLLEENPPNPDQEKIKKAFEVWSAEISSN